MSEDNGGYESWAAGVLVALGFVLGCVVGECHVEDLDHYGDPGKPCYPNGTCYRSTCIDVKDGETVCVESK